MICRTRPDELETFTPRTRWWLWSVVAVFVVVVVGLRLWQIARTEAQQKAWVARCSQIDALSQQSRKRIEALWNSRSWPKQFTRHELEVAVNGGNSFNLTRNGAVEVAKWIEPKSGTPFEFDFIDGRWSGLSAGGGSYLYPPPPKPSHLENSLERVRGSIAGWNSGYGPLCWLLLLVMTLSLRRWRPVMAETLLAVAIVCTVAWAVHPGRSLGLRGMLNNDMLFWGGVMLLVSTIAVRLTQMKKIKRPLPVCPQCGYNLTGNVSGVCPECGNAIPSDLAKHFGLGVASSRPAPVESQIS